MNSSESPGVEEIELFRLSNAGPVKKADVCLLCEKPGELITCNGPTTACHSSFHLSCVGLKSVPVDPFVCDECTTGLSNSLLCYCTWRTVTVVVVGVGRYPRCGVVDVCAWSLSLHLL